MFLKRYHKLIKPLAMIVVTKMFPEVLDYSNRSFLTLKLVLLNRKILSIKFSKCSKENTDATILKILEKTPYVKQLSR